MPAATRACLDRYGNLFLTYLYQVEDESDALSTDGGLTFSVVANISAAALPPKSSETTWPVPLRRPADHHRGPNAVWVVFNAGGPLVATGALVKDWPARRVHPGRGDPWDEQLHLRRHRHRAVRVMQACNLTKADKVAARSVNVDPTDSARPSATAPS
jgi:hypothetical protein